MGFFGGVNKAAAAAPREPLPGAAQPAAAAAAAAAANNPPAMDAKQKHAALAQIAFGSAAFAGAKPSQRNPFHKAGRYLIKLESITLSQSGNPQKAGQLGVGVTSTILFTADDGSSQRQEIAGLPAGPGHVAGTTVYQYFDMTNVSSMGAFKGMLAKIFDLPPSEAEDPRIPTMVTDPDQPYTGTCVWVSNNWGKTAGRGKSGKIQDFLYVNYEPGMVSRREIRANVGTEEGQIRPDVIAKAFPGDMLDRLCANEEAMEKAAAGGAQ